MKLKEKMLILAAALLLGIAGFNLIAVLPSLDIIRASRTAHYEIVVTASATAPSASAITG